MQREPTFEGFDELVRRPLSLSDPLSFSRIKALLSRSSPAAPFAFLVRQLTGKRCSPEEGRRHWTGIVALKCDMETRLGRPIGIQTAAVEYFTMIDRGAAVQHAVERADATGLWQEERERCLRRLRNEMLRSRRYHHALAAVLLEVAPAEAGSLEACLAVVVHIIQRTIRAVDMPYRIAQRRFLVILPNTNEREADELARRLRRTILQRAARATLPGGSVSVSHAAAQAGADDTVQAFLAGLEPALAPASQC